MSTLKLKLKLGNAKGRLTRAVSFVDTIETGTPLEMLEIRLEKLNEAWSDFAKVHDELLQTATEEQFKELEVEFSDYESRFFRAHSRLVQHIRKSSRLFVKIRWGSNSRSSNQRF